MKSSVRKTLVRIIMGAVATVAILAVVACGTKLLPDKPLPDVEGAIQEITAETVTVNGHAYRVGAGTKLDSGLAAGEVVRLEAVAPAYGADKATRIARVITQPYTTQGQWASLGYGKDGKLVVVDVDGIGDKAYNYLWEGNENTFLASKVLTFDNYSVIIGGDKDGAGIGNFSFAVFYNNNSELIGTAQNIGKLVYLTINENTAIIGWEANYEIQDKDKANPENNPILDALAKSLGYNSFEDNGSDGALITIGPGFDVQIDGQPRGKNTDYGAKVSVYRLKPEGGIEKIASQPPTLEAGYARNQTIEKMEIVNGTISLRISYEANDGKRYETSGTARLDDLVQSGIANNDAVKPAIKQ